MALTTKPYFGTPTTFPNTWGSGWGMFNPFQQQRQVAPKSVVDMWNKALETGDGGTLMAMSSDSDIRQALARALGLNVNQLSNIAMMKYSQASDKYKSMNTNAWTQARSQYVGARGQPITPGTTPTSVGSGAGGLPSLANPWSNMQMLFRDNTGMLHDPGDNPIWEQLNNAPVTPTSAPPPITWGRGRPNQWGGNRGNNGRPVTNPFQTADRRVGTPTGGTTGIPGSTYPRTTTPETPPNAPPPPPVIAPTPWVPDPRVGNPYSQQ